MQKIKVSKHLDFLIFVDNKPEKKLVKKKESRKKSVLGCGACFDKSFEYPLFYGWG